METPIPLDPGLCLLGNTTNLKLTQSSRKRSFYCFPKMHRINLEVKVLLRHIEMNISNDDLFYLFTFFYYLFCFFS